MPPHGTFGRISEFQDFNGGYEDITWASTSTDLKHGWYMVSVNDGTIQKVVDEPGGVVQFLTATADNDNVVLLSGPYRHNRTRPRAFARFDLSRPGPGWGQPTQRPAGSLPVGTGGG